MTDYQLPSQKWLEQFQAELKPFVLKGDYRGGLKIAEKARRLYPQCIEVRFQYAKLLGDWADELKGAKKTRAKKEAVSILRPIVRAISHKSVEFRFSVCINYYYQCQDYRGMYRFGKRLAKGGVRKGHYAQGVGAAFHAMHLREKRQNRVVRVWATNAKSAWTRYRLDGEPYYFAHYCMAMALVLLGEKESALRSLKNAAKLSRRTLDDWEFRDVLDLVNTA